MGKLYIPYLKKSRGARITFQHAGVLEDGELCRHPLRETKSTDTVILSDDALEAWSPSYTLHGFRYVAVTGWGPTDSDSALTLESVVAMVIHTDLESLGTFSCSNELINRLHENSRWSMRGNMIFIPTNCPQRDERLGWTGDIQVYAPSAGFLYDTTSILKEWLRDLAYEQADDAGVPPFAVPKVTKHLWPVVIFYNKRCNDDLGALGQYAC